MAYLSSPSSEDSMVVKSTLIEPDMGQMVDLVVLEIQRAAKILDGETMMKVWLTKGWSWVVHVINEGLG